MEYDGEKHRQENMVKVNEAKDRANEQAADVKSAADVRLESANRDVDNKKEIAASVGEGKDEIRQTRVNEINQKKEDEEMAVIDRDAKASAKAFESREDAFSKNPGAPEKEGFFRKIRLFPGLKIYHKVLRKPLTKLQTKRSLSEL